MGCTQVSPSNAQCYTEGAITHLPVFGAREKSATLPDTLRNNDAEFQEIIDNRFSHLPAFYRGPQDSNQLHSGGGQNHQTKITMGLDSPISWTDHTFNAWIGCTQVSPGCAQCYAMTDQSERKGVVGWGQNAPRMRVSAHARRQPLLWNLDAIRAAQRPRVFCSSLGDVFDPHPSIEPEWKAELWGKIAITAHLDWLVLTKRPESIAQDIAQFTPGGPPRNVWLGISGENQDWFDRRWKIIRDLPFAIKFLSYEPALGPIRLNESHRGLSWVIFGGETSMRRDKARPTNLDWARDIRDDCARLKIPFWFKQTGNWLNGSWVGKTATLYRAEHDKLDGRIIHELP